jgi:IS1 family transposase
VQVFVRRSISVWLIGIIVFLLAVQSPASTITDKVFAGFARFAGDFHPNFCGPDVSEGDRVRVSKYILVSNASEKVNEILVRPYGLQLFNVDCKEGHCGKYGGLAAIYNVWNMKPRYVLSFTLPLFGWLKGNSGMALHVKRFRGAVLGNPHSGLAEVITHRGGFIKVCVPKTKWFYRQPGSFFGLLGVGRSAHFIRLIADSYACQESNDNQTPVRVFKGCVPAWRAGLGCFCICWAFFVVIRKGWLWLGHLLVLGGIAIWLGKKVDCDKAKNDVTDSPALHSEKVYHKKCLTNHTFCNTFNVMANVLSAEKQTAIIAALAEGSSIRSIERITGVHRDTIMRLGVRVGKGCEMLMDSKMQDLGCNYLQLDEVWGFIGKKERHCRVDDSPEFGDVWTFCAIDSETKLVPSFKCGKRTAETANAFVQDIANRVRNRVQISTDALWSYGEAVERAFGADVDYGQIVKVYVHDSAHHPERQHSAPSPLRTVGRLLAILRWHWFRLAMSNG